MSGNMRIRFADSLAKTAKTMMRVKKGRFLQTEG